MAKFDKQRRSPAPRGDYNDPYQRAQRPARATARPARSGEGYAARPRPAGDYAARPQRGEDDGGGRARGFTVTLDPDIARVFRGDASVNKALRLVLQLMQVVQGPPQRAFSARSGEERAARPPARRGYQGSEEARGFKRKPRFGDDE